MAAAVLGESRARTAAAVLLRGPGLVPADALTPPPTRAQDGSGGAGRVRAAPAPTVLVPFEKKTLDRGGGVFRKRKRRVSSGGQLHSGALRRPWTCFLGRGLGCDSRGRKAGAGNGRVPVRPAGNPRCRGGRQEERLGLVGSQRGAAGPRGCLARRRVWLCPQTGVLWPGGQRPAGTPISKVSFLGCG